MAAAEILIIIAEMAKIGALLAGEDRTPTEQEKAQVKAAVQRANDLWEAVTTED